MTEEENVKAQLPFKISEHSPEERKSGLFGKIKELLPFFKKESRAEHKLAGRVHTELQHDAHMMIEQLKNLKENLKKELNSQDGANLWNSFEAVVNPLLREYGEIEKKLMVKEDSLEKKTSTIKSYNAWIEKAKLWVTLSSKPNDREGIIKAVVLHTMHISDMFIDRDIKTLREYRMHEINSLDIESEELSHIAKKIDAELALHVNSLHSLKHSKPVDLKLEHLQEWKSNVDQLREKHYNDALHSIDNTISALVPTLPEQEEEHEHLKEIFKLVAYLEEEVPVFLSEMEKLDLSDRDHVLIMEEHGRYLEEEVHNLNKDLRLTPELADRVQDLIHSINKAKKYFPSK